MNVRTMNYVEASEAPQRKTGQIKLHGPSAFAGMRKAGQLVAECLDALTDIVKPGVSTSRIDEFVFDFATSHGALPATLMYRGYRYSCCTSINHVVCHGMPNDRPLKEGDIVNIDVTLIVDGWHGDSSRMYAVGPIARKAERLIDITYEFDDARHCRDQAGSDPWRYRRGHSGLGRTRRHERCTRFLRPWTGPHVP